MRDRSGGDSCIRAALGGMLLLGAVNCGDVDTVVETGGSIQAAIDAMPMGASKWVVQVRPGVYKESLDITRAGVELRGVVSGPGDEERAILDGTQDGGKQRKDGMVVSGAYFTISGFLVRNFAGNGITTQKTHHVTFRDVITDNAGKYGL